MSINLPIKWDRTRPLTLADLHGWRAISYLRFSASLQKDGDSIERQRINTGRAIKALGLVLDRSLEDRAKSASKGHHRTRGELGRLLDAINAGSVQAGTLLIVEAVDRLTREGPLDAYPMLQTIIRAGIVLLVCGETEDDDAFDLYDEFAINDGKGDKLHNQIKSAYNYSKAISKRAKARHARRRDYAKQGIPVVPNGVPPFWINRDLGASKRGEPVHSLNQHKHAVERMFQAAAADRSLRQIADELLREDILHPHGRPWRASAIGRILRDDAVLGYWTPIQWIGGQRKTVGGSYLVYPETISPTLWQEVQDRLDGRKGVLRGAMGKSVPNLFTRRCICPTCGEGMRIDTGGGVRLGGRKRHLICGSYTEHRGCADRSRYDLNILEHQILQVLLEHLRITPIAKTITSPLEGRRANLEIVIRQHDESIAAVLPRIGGSPTLRAHVEVLSLKADAMREDLKAIIEQTSALRRNQCRMAQTWKMLKDTLRPALLGDAAARERLRLLLAAQDYKIVGDGGGRVIVHLGGTTVPIPKYSWMEAASDSCNAA